MTGRERLEDIERSVVHPKGHHQKGRFCFVSYCFLFIWAFCYRHGGFVCDMLSTDYANNRISSSSYSQLRNRSSSLVFTASAITASFIGWSNVPSVRFARICIHSLCRWFAVAGCSSTRFVPMMTTRFSRFDRILSIWVHSLVYCHVECDCSPPIDTEQPTVYRPHMFINERGEYECTVVETNRIRALCNLPPLEWSDCWNQCI